MLYSGYALKGAAVGLHGPDIERLMVLGRHRQNTIYVDSNAVGSANGQTWGDAYTSIETAVNNASADDFIYVAPLHVETVTAAGGLTLDKVGLTIIGLGNGNRRPQINFTTVAGADMEVDSAGCTMVNFRFTGGVDALTGPIDVDAADFCLIDCITEDVTGQAVDFIVTDANADRLRLVRWTHRGAAAAGADTAATIVGGANHVIEDAVVDGNFAVAAIENVTTAATVFRIYGGGRRVSSLRTRNAADVLVTLVSTTTGDFGPHIHGRLLDNAANITEAFVGAAMQFFQPCGLVNLAGERALNTNITATTDAIV